MTIRNVQGELQCECNDCGETHYGGTLEFQAFIADLKEQGWKTRKDDDEWQHLCPGCSWY